jgi:hypothetical protein
MKILILLLLPFFANSQGYVLRNVDGSVDVGSATFNSFGYKTGTGGTVTQTGNKTTAVTINKLCGQITTTNAALAAAAEISFTVNNNTVASTDVVFACIRSGGTAGAYFIAVGSVSDGAFTITIGNASTGSLSQALVINFIIFKSVNS